jgi:AcrR family transcriptional regulator
MRGNERFSGGHGGKKAQKLDAFIAAMMSHKGVEAAAAAAGISPATAYRWLADPDVIRRLAEARRDAMSRAMARLQEAATGAVDCLCEVQSSGESESARVSAARTILEQALRAVELQDIQQRLDNLETIAKSRWKGPGNDREAQAPTRTVGGVNGAP